MLNRTRIITGVGLDIRTRTQREITIIMSDDMAECIAYQIETYLCTSENDQGADAKEFAAKLNEALR